MSIIIIIHWRCSWILCSIIQNVIQFQPNAFSINVINTITRIKFRFKIHLCFKIHKFELKIQKSRGEKASSIGHCRKFAILQIIVALFHSLCPAHNLSVCTSHRWWHINFVEINSHHIVHFSFRSEKDHQSLTAAASYRHPSKRLGEVKPIELEWRSCHTSTLPHLYTSTLPHLHTSTLPHLHTSTIPQFHTSTFPWRSCPTSIGTSKRRWKDR